MNKTLLGRIDPDLKNITIWGAGFSGLVLGYFLKKNGYKVTIYEKSHRVGGKIKTHLTAFGLAESGANAIFLNQDSLELIKDLELEPLPASKRLKKLLFIDGKPRTAFQFNVMCRFLLNAHRKPPLISDGLTVADFFRPLVGEKVVSNYLSPALGGIYATPSEKLHFKSLFQDLSHKTQFKSYWQFVKLLLKNRKFKNKMDLKGSISFEGGMQVLIDRLHHYLKPNIKLNANEKFELDKNNIICTDALNAAELLKNIRPEISNELKRIKYQELSSSTVFLKREIKSLNKSFGILLPLGTGFHSIGIVNNKAVFPANNANVFAYTMIAKKELSEFEILEDLKLLHAELVPEDIEHIESYYWNKAIPVYDVQRFLSIRKIDHLLINEKNIAFFGNYVAGISLREMITAAKNFSTSLKKTNY